MDENVFQSKLIIPINIYFTSTFLLLFFLNYSKLPQVKNLLFKKKIQKSIC